MYVGTVPEVGVDGKVGVGEEDSVEPMWVRGTAVGLVERSDTEGEERSGDVPEEDEAGEEDWALAKRKDKRMVRIVSWKTEAVILKTRRTASWKREK